jgi:hypothetical protein
MPESIIFESGSIVIQTGEYSFSRSGLQRITVPSSMEVISVGCFSQCCSLEWLGFEAGSNLQRIEKDAFTNALRQQVLLPNSITIISGRVFNRKLLKWATFDPNPTNFRVRSEMVEDESDRTLIPDDERVTKSAKPSWNDLTDD